MSALRQQRGITLIEVLVSILILGLALISLAGLQSYTVKYQLGSANRAVLSMLVSDFAERVRANREAAPGGSSAAAAASPYLLSATWAEQDKAPGAAETDCVKVGCADAATLARWDMALWRQRVREELPRGSAQVSGTLQNGMDVTIMWQDNELGAESPVCSASPTPAEARNCCPVSLPAGVRCANFLILP